MTDIAAAIGLGQFVHIEAITARRQALARHYFSCFGKEFELKTGAQLPVADFVHSNWHLFEIVLPNHVVRADFMAKMLEMNIGLGYHYAAIHLFTMYRNRGFKPGMFPMAERIGRQIVTLPMFSTLQENEIERTVDAVKSVLAGFA